jgi:hypothetical protein
MKTMNLEIIPLGVEPELLDSHGIIQLKRSAELDLIPRNALRLFCHNQARYVLVTSELVTWLRALIADRKAIEIGSGAGDLAYHLGIPGTDNHCQEWPDVKAYYNLTGQPLVRYPDFVENLDALDAIKKYKPDIVIGAWVTQWVDPHKPIPAGGGSMYGVNESLLLDTGVTYVMIGNDEVHKKEIMQRPHSKYKLRFLRSRASHPEFDSVYVWPK